MFCKNRCSQNFCKLHRKTSVLVPLFNKVAGLKTCKFIKNRLQHRCFSVKFTKFMKSGTSLFRNFHSWITLVQSVVSFYKSRYTITKLRQWNLYICSNSPVLNGQLPSSRFFLKSSILKLSWLKFKIFVNFTSRSQFL